RTLPDALLEPTARGISRRFQAAPVDVVDPAVIAAADAALERDPELERRSAMRAVQVQHADAPAAVAEDDQILAQNPRPQGRRREIARERHGLPEPAQVLAARGARSDFGQLGIRRRNLAATVAVEWTGFGFGAARSSSLHGSLLSADELTESSRVAPPNARAASPGRLGGCAARSARTTPSS